MTTTLTRPNSRWHPLSLLPLRQYFGNGLKRDLQLPSSLLRNGVPVSSDAKDSLLGDGRPYIRLSVSSIAEIEALDLARLAIAAGSKTILIEIFPFCREFANKVVFDPEKEHGPDAWAQTILVQSAQLLKTFNRRVLGHSARKRLASAFMQESGFVVGLARNRPKLSDLYPLNLHQPFETAELSDVLALAKSKDVEIYFLAPPRSELAAKYPLAHICRPQKALLNVAFSDINLYELFPFKYCTNLLTDKCGGTLTNRWM